MRIGQNYLHQYNKKLESVLISLLIRICIIYLRNLINFILLIKYGTLIKIKNLA